MDDRRASCQSELVGAHARLMSALDGLTRACVWRDRYCLNYTRAYRAGLLNGPGAKASHK